MDLHAQPEAIIEELDQTIAQAKAENKSIDQVGIRFMRFCGKYDLNRISEQAQLYVEPFNARLYHDQLRAKTLVKDKFWIVEQNGQKVRVPFRNKQTMGGSSSANSKAKKCSTHRRACSQSFRVWNL